MGFFKMVLQKNLGSFGHKINDFGLLKSGLEKNNL